MPRKAISSVPGSFFGGASQRAKTAPAALKFTDWSCSPGLTISSSRARRTPAYSSKVARYAVVGIVAPHHRGQMGVLVGDGWMPVHPTPSRNRRQRSGVTGHPLPAARIVQRYTYASKALP